MSVDQLPAKALEIAREKGWEEDVVLIHLLGFIARNVDDAEARIDAYFAEVAAEEDAEIRALFPENDA